jgi:hypothetical protein
MHGHIKLKYTYSVSLFIHKIRKIGLMFSSNVNDDLKKPSRARKCKTGSISKPNDISLGYFSVLRTLVLQVSFLHARGVEFESWSESQKS